MPEKMVEKAPDTRSPVERLQAAKARLADPARWTKLSMAIDAEGDVVDPTEPEAACWCIEGALDAEGLFAPEERPTMELCIQVAAEFGFKAAADFNDAPSTTHADVMAFFDRVIILATPSSFAGGVPDFRPQSAPLHDMATATPKYAHVFCSQCGGDFGPGDHGFSHCESHVAPKGAYGVATWNTSDAPERTVTAPGQATHAELDAEEEENHAIAKESGSCCLFPTLSTCQGDGFEAGRTFYHCESCGSDLEKEHYETMVADLPALLARIARVKAERRGAGQVP